MKLNDISSARLAQSVEHETLNLRVVGSSPTLGGSIFLILSIINSNIFYRIKNFKCVINNY